MPRLRHVLLLAVATFSLGACHSGPDSSASGPKSAQSNQAQPAVPVSTEAAQTTSLSHLLETYGTVEFSPEGSRVQSIPADGRVVAVNVTAGQAVDSGTLLLSLEPTANARLEVDKAKIDVDFARQEAQRQRSLREQGLATNADVTASDKTLAVAEATRANVERRHVGGEERMVRATMDGVVEAVSVKAGQVVAAGTELIRIADARRIRARLGIEQDDLGLVHAGEAVDLELLNVDGKHFSGRIERLDRQVDPKTRRADAIVPLRAAPGLLPGAMVRGRITVATHPNALVVPRSAVLYYQGKPYLFVADQGRAHLRWVETGIDNGKLVEIRQALQPGEQVVTVGNAELKDGVAVRVERNP